MKKEVQLTKGQKEILGLLKYEHVSIVDTGKKISLTKFGLVVKTIKPATFEVIKPYLSERIGVNNNIYNLIING